MPGRAQKMRGFVQAHPDAAMFLHDTHIVDANGASRGLWRCPLPSGDAPVPHDMLMERLIVQNFIGISAPIMNRDAYLKVGGLDGELWHTADWDLYLKIALTGPVYYRDEALAAFRVHGNSLTITGSRDPGDFREQLQLVQDRYAHAVAPDVRAAALRAGRTSIDVNVALARAMHGEPQQVLAALTSVAALGPTGIVRYLRDSRITERVASRLRVKLAGNW